MSEKRKKYDREFREGAVRIVRETGKPIAQVARDLGIHEGTLGNWVAQDREAREGRGELTRDDVEELKRLRSENRQAERHLIAQHSVTQALALAPTLAAAAPAILRALLLPTPGSRRRSHPPAQSSIPARGRDSQPAALLRPRPTAQSRGGRM